MVAQQACVILVDDDDGCRERTYLEVVIVAVDVNVEQQVQF